MTKTVEEARRELFESIWPMPSNCMRCGNTYAATSYNAWQAAEFINRWKGFNKALDAVEIQLPGPGAAMASVFDYQHSTRNKNVTGTTNWAANVGMVVVDDCRAAIEQTGLGLRIK